MFLVPHEIEICSSLKLLYIVVPKL